MSFSIPILKRIVITSVVFLSVVLPSSVFAADTSCAPHGGVTSSSPVTSAGWTRYCADGWSEVCTILPGGAPDCVSVRPDGTTAFSSVNTGEISVGTTYDESGKKIDQKIGSPALDALGAVFDWVGKLTFEALAWVGVQVTFLLQQILAFFLYIAATFLDFVVRELVLGMGKYVATGSTSGIYISWSIIRDLANIGIIGGLVAAAFGTILQLQNINASKFLARIILVALLVNFSYFFAAAIIDTSNFTAGIVYRSIVQGGCAELDCTITSRFMQLSNFQSLAGNAFLDNFEKEHLKQSQNTGSSALGTLVAIPSTVVYDFGQKWGTNTANLVYNIMFVILLCVTTYVFLSVLALLIGRFVALILLLIASPLGIAGLAIPGVQKYAEEWWKTLFSQAIFAPVYFLLVGISLIVLEGFASVAAKTAVGAAHNRNFIDALANPGSASSNADLLGIIITSLVGLVFMVLSLRAAKELSKSQYLEPIYKYTDTAYGWMPRLYAAGLSKTATQSVGRGADFAADWYNKKMASWQPKSDFGRFIKSSGLDRSIAHGLESVAKSQMGGKESFVESRKAKAAREVELGLEHEREESMEGVLHKAGEVEKLRAAYEESVRVNGAYEQSKATADAYNEFLNKKADVERAINDIPDEAWEYYIERRDWDAFKRVAPYLATEDFNRLAKAKSIPKGIRDHMRSIKTKNKKGEEVWEGRFANVMRLVDEANGLSVPNSSGENLIAGLSKFSKAQLSDAVFVQEVTKDKNGVSQLNSLTPDQLDNIEQYVKLRRTLYNEFERGGITTEDLPELMNHEPDLFGNRFFMDGGIPIGAKQTIQKSKAFGTNQQRQAKNTMRKSTAEIVELSGMKYRDEDTSYGEFGKDLSTELTTLGSANFERAVKAMKGQFAGKQPGEIPIQFSKMHAPTIAFAAAAGASNISQLPDSKDPYYLKKMVGHYVQLNNLLQSGQLEIGETAEEKGQTKARVAAVIDYMRVNQDGSAKYGDMLAQAEAQWGSYTPPATPPPPASP